MSKYTKLASEIIENVGGKENVISLRHCITRLRFRLNDESKANDEHLKNMEGVITVMKAMGEYMVVIGEHVPDVYKEVCEQLGVESYQSGSEATENGKKQGILTKVMDVIMSGMGPSLNVLCACGIIKGLLVVLTFAGIAPDSGVYMLINAAGDCFFQFMPLLLGYNVAKKLQIDPAFGFVLAAALCYPAIQNVDIPLFGTIINASYIGTFLPAIFGVAVAAPIYKAFNKVIPESFRGFLTPTLTMLIIFPLTFIFIGPAANWIGTMISAMVNSIVSFSPLLAGIILGGLWQVLVLFGISGVLVMFSFMDLMQGVPSQMLALMSFVCFAQIGVVLAIYIKTKDKKLKSIALPAFISGIFGVTEPAIYGVTLPRLKMFVVSCIGGAVSGLIVALADLKMYSYAGMGLVGLLGFLNPEGPQFIGIGLATIIPFVGSFFIAYVTFKDEESSSENNISVEKGMRGTKEIIKAPISGMIKPLKEASDDAFASELLGQGVVIYPEDRKVYAPCSGVVKTLFPTGHAIGIISEGGCEVLIHIGMNTVSLEGEGFTTHVKQEETVEEGQLLISFDKDKMEKEGYNLETLIIVTNSADYLDIVEMTNAHVNHGESLITLVL